MEAFENRSEAYVPVRQQRKRRKLHLQFALTSFDTALEAVMWNAYRR